MAKGGKRSGAGRKRKPPELRVLEGTFDKKLHGGAPAVVPGFPRPPKGLTLGERELWAEFPKPAWIGQTDAVAVHAAVSVYERILWMQGRQAEADDEKRANLIDREAKLWGRLMSVLASLGLTPADRAKIQAPKADEVMDKWAGIL
jgi:hypothetical protein